MGSTLPCSQSIQASTLLSCSSSSSNHSLAIFWECSIHRKIYGVDQVLRLSDPAVALKRTSRHIPNRLLTKSRASTKEREWQNNEYEEDVVQRKQKDFPESAAVPEFLDVVNSLESVAVSSSPAGAELAPSTSYPSFLEDWNDKALKQVGRGPWTQPNVFNLLDACQMVSDLTQVRKAYDWLLSKGFLRNFGKEANRVTQGERRLVTDAVLKDSTGLTASQLSPKRWNLSGSAVVALPIGIALYSYLRDSGVELRPFVAFILALGFYDALNLGGTGLLQVRSMWLPYRQRILVREAGKVLVAYLLGCPIRGVILDPIEAFKSGVQGQGGAQFWDPALEKEFAQLGIPSSKVERYSIVIFAGVAAEALVYGEVQGGENDENLFKKVVARLQPSWKPAKISDQARWAILKAFQLLKDHQSAHTAVVRALEQESSLGSLIRAIEEAIP